MDGDGKAGDKDSPRRSWYVQLSESSDRLSYSHRGLLMLWIISKPFYFSILKWLLFAIIIPLSSAIFHSMWFAIEKLLVKSLSMCALFRGQVLNPPPLTHRGCFKLSVIIKFQSQYSIGKQIQSTFAPSIIYLHSNSSPGIVYITHCCHRISERRSICYVDVCVCVMFLVFIWLRFSSTVYNWTVEEVTDWLERHVELGQYVTTFKLAKIDGTMLPR